MWFCAHSNVKMAVIRLLQSLFLLNFESFSLALPIYLQCTVWALAVFMQFWWWFFFFYDFSWIISSFICLQITKVETIANCAHSWIPSKEKKKKCHAYARFQLAFDLLFNKRLPFFTKLIPTNTHFNRLLQFEYQTKSFH